MATHTSPFAGTWYPGDSHRLAEFSDGLFDAAARRCGPVYPGGIGFVVPHAGLSYSGTVAAAVYRYLEAQRPKRVLLLGFCHQGASQGLWIPEVDRIATPLGEVELDREAIACLTAQPEFARAKEADVCDHSVEIQLPLLKRAVPEARLVPIYVSHPPAEVRETAGRALAKMLDAETVIVASTDLTHYGAGFQFQPFPVDDAVAERIRGLDDSVMEAACSLSEGLWFMSLRETSATVCGRDPVALLLATLRQWETDEVFGETLDYQTSGEMTGDYSHSVSYGALGFFPSRHYRLDAEDQRLLLDSARRTLEHYLETGERRPLAPAESKPSLSRRGCVFVSLHQGGVLRGCVGRCGAPEPLARSVPEMTLAAALEDTRFAPVARSETGIEIEISLLSPLKRILSRSQFRVNEHGAVLHVGLRRGLLLPQVATERNWTAAEFLDALARKAGVRPSVYDYPSTQLYVFRAQVFH